MSTRKDSPSKEDKYIRDISRDIPKDAAHDTKLHQDLNLSKGEREKGASPAYAVGKKVEDKERKGKK